jgi:phosphoribosylamine--glycine ligase
MGAFAPVPEVNRKLLKEIYNTILMPTIRGMEEEGKLYQGVLYAGLMLTEDGPKVLEFNARFGDPETQALMMLLKSDLYPALKNATEGRLRKKDLVFRKGASVCVVLAAEGYPGRPKIGDVVYGLDTINNPSVQIFDSGMIMRNGQVETDGGRVLAVTAYGKDIEDARKKLYPHIGENGVHFRGMHYRKDIGI